MTFVIRTVMIATLALMFATRLSAEWFKGNTHTHTVNSGGDSTPYATAEGYRLHGYQFLFMTDHNTVTDTAGLNAMVDSNGQFLVLPGEEVTSEFKTLHGSIYVHVNALGPQKSIESMRGVSVRDTLQKNIDAIERSEQAISTLRLA
jgi:predicted metal-dependent phosphoesterase TrpH